MAVIRSVSVNVGWEPWLVVIYVSSIYRAGVVSLCSYTFCLQRPQIWRVRWWKPAGHCFYTFGNGDWK